MAGDSDLRRAVGDLERHLPEPLRPLARVAYNYRWSWSRDGYDAFAAIDADGFARSGANPVRFLRDVPGDRLEAAAADASYRHRIQAVARDLDAYLAHEPAGDTVAFFCAEFGVHASLPVYSGGLGVLAGDYLKEASDRGSAFVGVGLLYRRGYFHQRLDAAGWQHEYWTEIDPESLPAVRVTNAAGSPVEVRVRMLANDVAAHVWRVDVGRVPLYLLDAGVRENSPLARWVTARLYDSSHTVRLMQYGLLGVGGVRMLRALGIEPSVVHLNEGHAALAALELAHASRVPGQKLDDAIASARDRVVFTTHTPVAAGNETYDRSELLGVFDELCAEYDVEEEAFLGFGRVRGDDAGERAGMTPLAIRASRSVNAVSRRHGEVAAQMWAGMADRVVAVTNGVHLPTWMAPPMRSLLDRHLRAGWEHDVDAWAGVDAVPDAELWAVRNDLRATLVEGLRDLAVTDRLARGDSLEYALSFAFDPDRLTIGFARRLATYKRLHLLSLLPERTLALLDGGGVQMVLAGKAHPSDDDAKRVAQRLFGLKDAPPMGQAVAFVDDYDLRIAALLVAGCDVWLNLPRPPLEASGTSGMKAALNGGLNLSVLDGWWAEAYDGSNGWAVDGAVDPDDAVKDVRDANAVLDLIEHEVRPLFARRGDDGVPREWVAMVKRSLRTVGTQFVTRRMLVDYERAVYRPT